MFAKSQNEAPSMMGLDRWARSWVWSYGSGDGFGNVDWCIMGQVVAWAWIEAGFWILDLGSAWIGGERRLW